MMLQEFFKKHPYIALSIQYDIAGNFTCWNISLKDRIHGKPLYGFYITDEELKDSGKSLEKMIMLNIIEWWNREFIERGLAND